MFQEIGALQPKKIKNRGDLESELFGGSDFGESISGIRDNEGEAAEHGVYFDDTNYDYMQHMRDLDGGDGSGESFFVEAPTKPTKGKGKAKMSLEDALRNASIAEESLGGPPTKAPSLLDPELLPSKKLRKVTYENQQDVPDTIAGFQPDMDPRLREVLIALDDEAYVDDEEDLFNEITKDGEELTLADFEELGLAMDEDDEGWESDHTAKPTTEYKTASTDPALVPPTSDVTMSDALDHGDGDWMAEFSKAKQNAKPAAKKQPYALFDADIQSSILSGFSTHSKRKKRKGAMTSESGYSMSSASLARTEALTLLDARFDKIQEDYAEDDVDDDEDGGASVMTGTMSTASKLSTASRASTSSQAPSLVDNKAFNGMMDEFLNDYSMSGKKRVKKGRYQSGMEQLDEIRRELGRPKVALQKAS